MKTQHYPIDEDANTITTWIYNGDDSIQQVVDPRNAITAFTYNNRGLVTDIGYTQPANQTAIPDTPDVHFAYDAPGNRTEMTDGTGTTTYLYNDLSQLTSEVKDFTDLTNNLTISYTYNLGGGLKSITDPFSSTVNYTNDKTGRLTAVTGTAWAQNTTGNYASNIKYRAFGQIKRMDYNLPTETSQIKMDYDNRLRVSHFEVSSASESSGYLLKSDFTYTADSRVQAKDDLLDNKWDRTMKYDHAGRLVFNQFGIGQGSDNSSKRVYEQTIGYDAFSQMIERDTTHWNVNGGFTATYTNGRQQDPNVSYDVAGNIVHEAKGDTNSFQDTTIDAAGRRSEMLERWHLGNGGQESFFVFERVTKQGYDGDGRLVKSGKASRRVNITPTQTMPEPVYEYQIWSSVLGASLTSVLSNGTKFETKVFAGGALIAKQRHVVENNQNYDSIEWTTADPVTGTIGRYNYTSAGNTRFKEETEPLGQKISNEGTADAPTPQNGGLAGRADDPEWQCQTPQQFYGTFSALPEYCQRSLLTGFK